MSVQKYKKMLQISKQKPDNLMAEKFQQRTSKRKCVKRSSSHFSSGSCKKKLKCLKIKRLTVPRVGQDVEQGFVSHGPWPKHSPPTVFANHVVSERSHTHLFTCASHCFHAPSTSMGSGDRSCIAHKV